MRTFVKCKECRFLATDRKTCLLGPPVYEDHGSNYHGYNQGGSWIQPNVEKTTGCFSGESSEPKS